MDGEAERWNGWNAISWRGSVIVPIVARSLRSEPHLPWRKPTPRRALPATCRGERDLPGPVPTPRDGGGNLAQSHDARRVRLEPDLDPRRPQGGARGRAPANPAFRPKKAAMLKNILGLRERRVDDSWFRAPTSSRSSRTSRSANS